ncbi:hypothetical protein [Pseudarthrobacter sp. H2]|uniref:hypothetical protein n=1 Tax=Pseudarthrobacter sp. H2 TaxID=3418415 RepID=UPI003CECA355
MRATITTHNGSFGGFMFGKFTAPRLEPCGHAQRIAFELMKAVPDGQPVLMLTLMGWLE